MLASHQNIQRRLQAFDFTGLFTQELMWNHHVTRDLAVPIDDVTYTLKPIAQRGMAVFECVPPTDAQFPKYTTRRKIDTQISKTAREHIIIFHDNAQTVQVWQWVKREAGKPSACREQLFYKGQSGDALVQKIQGIAFGLEDEANVAETVAKVGAAFDVEKVTKKFYDLFKKEHDAFLKFVGGIPDEHLERWYVSVMLNRLMFIYFIQKKGFLGSGDLNYLRKKLAESKGRGRDKFYRDFLCALFFEGFAKQPERRSTDANRLLGLVPYLNGGLFLKHQIEELHGKALDIADKAFDRIFDFFEQYDWHLDDRPTRKGNEINPDVLGYVFEKYINQREMGAYYTKEDITGYISQNTIIPTLFDMARKSCRIAFEGEHSIWPLLQADPDRYIHASMLRGMDMELPDYVAAGISDVRKRGEWNKPADPQYALATETWREVVARRSRCEEIRKKLAGGEVRSIIDLVTYNLDIRRFAEEAIRNCETPELLSAFYKALRNVSVLDPACGSGAFLFAALNILERLYDSCLVRMQAFVDDLDRSGEQRGSEKFKDFRQALAEMNDKARHPNPQYFILKSIILNNLYGVDVMEEATEICKLRLFLRLVAQVDASEKIEPLPDIDFNVRAGNTLVGFATEVELIRVLGSKLDFENKAADIKERAQLAELAFERFREMQVQDNVTDEDFGGAKDEVRNLLSKLRSELDVYLSGDYGVRTGDKGALKRWQESHRPFHWFVEFYGIMQKGGFHAVIGNPPYVVYPNQDVSYNVLESRFETINARNLYAYFFEQSLRLAQKNANVGLIVQLTAMSSERIEPLQTLLQRRGGFFAISFPRRPQSVFTDVEMPVVILISTPVGMEPRFVTTHVNRFYSQERRHVVQTLRLAQHGIRRNRHRLAKFGSPLEVDLFDKIVARSSMLAALTCSRSNWSMYYQEACRYWVKAILGAPYFRRNGKRIDPPHGRTIYFASREAANLAICLLNSSLFYWLYSAMCDCEHVNDSFVREFPVPANWEHVDWGELSTRLMQSLDQNATRKVIQTKQGHRIEYDEINAVHSKSVIDEIDVALGGVFGLSATELDFVTNYDLKYRAGSEAEVESNAAANVVAN
ncbi:MAG: DNA methyltransferase [Candidatus Acidiferrum sp.]